MASKELQASKALVERWQSRFRAVAAKHKADKIIETDEFLVFMMDVWEEFENAPLDSRKEKENAKKQPKAPGGESVNQKLTNATKKLAGVTKSNKILSKPSEKANDTRGPAKANDSRNAKKNAPRKKNSVAPLNQ